MSLVAGPGRGGTGATASASASASSLPPDLRLAVDQHVRYIQSLDTVGELVPMLSRCMLMLHSAEMNWIIG